MRAQGLRPRRGGTTLAMTTCSVLPSVPYDAVGPPNSIFLSRLNTQPTRCPVNASPLPSRTATHDSGPTWFATPWLGGTCTRETYRFVPAHRMVKILEHPAGQKFTRFQDRRRHRRSGSRMSILTSRPCLLDFVVCSRSHLRLQGSSRAGSRQCRSSAAARRPPPFGETAAALERRPRVLGNCRA